MDAKVSIILLAYSFLQLLESPCLALPCLASSRVSFSSFFRKAYLQFMHYPLVRMPRLHLLFFFLFSEFFFSLLCGTFIPAFPVSILAAISARSLLASTDQRGMVWAEEASKIDGRRPGNSGPRRTWSVRGPLMSPLSSLLFTLAPVPVWHGVASLLTPLKRNLCDFRPIDVLAPRPIHTGPRFPHLFFAFFGSADVAPCHDGHSFLIRAVSKSCILIFFLAFSKIGLASSSVSAPSFFAPCIGAEDVWVI